MVTVNETRAKRSPAPRRRIWVQHVAVETSRLQMRVDAARARTELTASQQVTAAAIDGFIATAHAAAFRDDPVPGRLANWWRGTLVEAAYLNMHNARTALFDLYTDDELRAEIPMVVARANATLHRDDPRRMTVAEMNALPQKRLRPRMRRVVGDSYEQLDLEHRQLRSFRNIVLMAAAFLLLSVAVTLYFVTTHPTWVPLCFDSADNGQSCPSGQGSNVHPTWADILIVAGMGALGGAFAATLSIRNLRGTSTPYDVPVALAALKMPMGALTAILGLVAIKGGFVPGLSDLDNQSQVLAYALLFGFAQQALSRLLDMRAQDLLEGLPGGEATTPLPGAKGEPVPPAQPTGAAAPAGGPAPVEGVAGAEVAAGEATEGPPTEVVTTDAAPSTALDRPVEEPEGATQEDQFKLLKETGNERVDQTEDEEAELLKAEFGEPDAQGIYQPPNAAPPDAAPPAEVAADAPAAAGAGEATAADEGAPGKGAES
jgi:hypothetical protein